MDAMAAYMASIQQQQPPNPAPEMDKQCVSDVIKNIHSRHALFADGDGYNYDETFHSRHNKEVTTVISSYCKVGFLVDRSGSDWHHFESDPF
ncbi:hypothetical protein INT45_013090 [Circinella minor]|uniref:Uncharacterized protein n=1 Tax=Circinella minor TaxID=1195481 RepID=A0A8H7RGX8_9FUNG|nr:hypothetical protein INT45_013090 [Circinella minor]